MSNTIKALCLLVIIEQNPMSKVSKLVPAWHEELLLDKYGDKVHVQEGKEEVVELEAIDLSEEVQRLSAQYGIDEDTKVGIFERVYGRGTAGARRLQRAIEEAIEAAANFAPAVAEAEPEVVVEAAPAKAAKASKAKAPAADAALSALAGEGAADGGDPLGNN